LADVGVGLGRALGVGALGVGALEVGAAAWVLAAPVGLALGCALLLPCLVADGLALALDAPVVALGLAAGAADPA